MSTTPKDGSIPANSESGLVGEPGESPSPPIPALVPVQEGCEEQSTQQPQKQLAQPSQEQLAESTNTNKSTVERNQNPREADVDVTREETPTGPPLLCRTRVVRNTLPGAVAVQGIQQQEQQVPSQAEAYTAVSEQENSINDNGNNSNSNHAVGLVEAEAVDDVAHPQAVAHPSMDGTHRRETITRKYQLRFAGFVILLLLGCGIIIGSICGAGLCGSSDSVESTKTSRDILQAPKMRSVLTTILGKDYFDGVEDLDKAIAAT